MSFVYVHPVISSVARLSRLLSAQPCLCTILDPRVVYCSHNHSLIHLPQTLDYRQLLHPWGRARRDRAYENDCGKTRMMMLLILDLPRFQDIRFVIYCYLSSVQHNIISPDS